MTATVQCEECGEDIVIEFSPLLSTEERAYVTLHQRHQHVCEDA